MPLGMEIGLGPGDFVLDGDPATPRKGHTHPTQFFANVYCGQTAEWIKTPLGTEVYLGPGHIVLDGIPAPCERGTAAPCLFGPYLLWPRSPISASAELLYSNMEPQLHNNVAKWASRAATARAGQPRA